MNKEEIKKMIADDFDNFINERLDSAIIFKYISNLEKENLKLKEQYCERTDCSGRLGNSKKVEELEQEKKQLKEQLQQKEDIINKAKEYNNQIIKDTKEFYRPTSDLIYSGDCLIDLAEQNIKILDNKGE